MVLFFSGTGNSEYVARYLADRLSDGAIDLGQAMKKGETLDINSDKPYILVAPIYISAIPLAVEDFLKGCKLSGCEKMYFVVTCAGSGSSAAPVSAKRMCKRHGKIFMGVATLSMPQNYIMYFKMQGEEANNEKFAKAVQKLPDVVRTIEEGGELEGKSASLMHRTAASRPVIKMCNKLLIGSKKFRVTDKCISCGKCEKVCPKNVIKMADGRPVWDKKGCLHCTGCINKCPTGAIEYGKKTAGKFRYSAAKYVCSESGKEQ